MQRHEADDRRIDQLFAHVLEIDGDAKSDGRLNLSDAPFWVIGVADVGARRKIGGSAHSGSEKPSARSAKFIVGGWLSFPGGYGTLPRLRSCL